MKRSIVILDNYDSFVYNLYQILGSLAGQAPLVLRNDKTSIARVLAHKPTHLVISPGPGNPEEPSSFGICREAILQLGGMLPTLGVCLGHQGIGVAFGGKVIRAPKVMHGKSSSVVHDGSGLFFGLPSPLSVMRYHSLVLDERTLPECLQICAQTDDGVIMGIAHKTWPLWGVQFHPESIGTPFGPALLSRFLSM